MTSQQLLQRLRPWQQWLRRAQSMYPRRTGMSTTTASLRKDTPRLFSLAGDDTSWIGLAGVLGVISLTTAGAHTFYGAPSESESAAALELTSIAPDNNTAITPTPGQTQQKAEVPPFSLPPISNLLNNNFQCDCESSKSSGKQYNLFGRLSSLRRNSTIVQYKNEVSQQSLRTLYKVNWKEPLGQGGFGAVYSAKDKKTGEIVALKQISKKYTDNVGFQREMEAFLHLRRAGGHPNICGLRENFDEGNYFYFSLDLISGGELFDHLIRSGPYSEEDAARLVREVASALSFMHGIGFVHGCVSLSESIE